MKRTFALLLALTMIISLSFAVVGCDQDTTTTKPAASSDDTDTTTTKDNDTTTTESDEVEGDELTSAQGVPLVDKEMTLELWDIATEEPTKGIQEAAVARFMEKYPNITVNQTHIQNDTYKERLIVAMSAQQSPEMYIHWGGGPMNEYIDSGFGSDITELFETYCTVPFLPAAIAQSSYNGKIYAIPFGGLGGCGIFYNTEIFEELSLDVPETISQLETVSETLIENDYIPFSLANLNKWTGSMYFMYLATRHSGVDAFNAAVDGSGSFTDDAFMYAAETIQDWIDRGFFPEGVNSLNTDDGQDRELMYTEQAAMMLHGSWQARSMQADSEEFYQKISYFPFPALDGSDADPSITVGTSIGNGFSFALNDDPEKLNYAFVLSTEFYNDDIYNQAQLDSNTIPSIEGMGDSIEDRNMQLIWQSFSSASNVQLWYDQYLPPLVSERHKDTCQEIFGLTMTPQEANESLQQAMDEYLSGQ